MSEERIDLRELVERLCEEFGLPYNRTAEIVIRPAEVQAVIFLEREGRKYIDPETNEAAVETKTFKVRT